MGYARHQFELSAPQADGQPLLAHLQAAEQRTGRPHRMIAEAPPMPGGCSQLWRDYLELHGSRGFGSMGSPMRVTFADIDAWQRVRGIKFDQWEIDCIRKVDSLWLSDFAPQAKATEQ